MDGVQTIWHGAWSLEELAALTRGTLVEHLGRQTHIWEVRITTEADKLVCIARLTTSIQPRAGMPARAGETAAA